VARDVGTYLRELQAAMVSAGADPAMVQDALFDAEEYLQAEMVAGGVLERGTATYEARFATVADAYGAPEEVAAAYLGTASGAEAAAWVETVSAAAVAPVAAAAPAVDTATVAAAAATPVITEPPVIDALEGMTAAAAAEAAMAEAAPQAEPETVAEPAAAAAPAAATSAAAGAPAAGGYTAPAPGASAPYPPTGAYPPPYAAGAAAANAPAKIPSVWQQIFGVVVDPAVYKALLYMILSLGLGIAYFTLVVTGVSTAGGMLVLIVGIPLFLLVLGMVRGMALFESRIVEGLLGTRMPRRERSEPPNAGLLQRVWFWVKDSRTWASMAYMILMLPLGIAYFTIAVTGLATGFGLLGSPIWVAAGPYTYIDSGIEHQWSYPVWATPLAMIGGVIVLLLTLHVVRWIGRGHAAFAKAMLVRLAK
jgi:Putative sensor